MKHLIRATERTSCLDSILSEETEPFRMGLQTLQLSEQEHFDLVSKGETVLVLLSGKAKVHLKDATHLVTRENGFDENVCAIQMPKGASLKISALSAKTEWIVISTANDEDFEPRVIDKHAMVDNEHRGKGTLGEASHRIVRTFFDSRNSAGSKLVVGEVVNFGGKWSSYPPHHHPQPEIYHYRFQDARGYGHGEVGDDVYKIRDGDTLLIPPNLDHAQVSAPGYPMYYLWVIRESESLPYSKPIFAPEHAWLLE